VAESYRGLADLFAPAAHPRAPAGAATGGQFVSADSSKGEAGGKGASADKTDQVKAVQKLLGLKPTGVFSKDDAEKLKAYQKAHGLVVDGKAGTQTINALLGKGKKGPGALSAADRKALLDVIRGPAKADAKKQAAKPAATAAAKRALAHEKVGHTGKGLWGHKGMQLPAFIQHIANDLIEKRGMDESRAIATAVSQVKKWAAGGEDVKPETRAKAAAALAEWEAMKAKTSGGSHRMTTYTRSFALEDITVRSGGDGRTVDAYAAVFNTAAPVSDQDGQYEEVIDPAAFNRAIEHARRAKGGWNIPVMFNHGMTIFHTPSERHSVPIGIPVEIRADARGLFTRTRYHNTPAADEVLEAIREGSITAYSFSGAFHRSDPMVPRGGFRRSHTGDLPTVRRTESTLREYGPATFPVYAGAEVVGVRAEQAALVLGSLSPDEIERLVTIFRAGTPLAEEVDEYDVDLDEVDPPVQGTPEPSGLAAADAPPPMIRRHASPAGWDLKVHNRELIQRRRADWIRARGAPQ
jgi:HK97 family phage prohead protease